MAALYAFCVADLSVHALTSGPPSLHAIVDPERRPPSKRTHGNVSAVAEAGEDFAVTESSPALAGSELPC